MQKFYYPLTEKDAAYFVELLTVAGNDGFFRNGANDIIDQIHAGNFTFYAGQLAFMVNVIHNYGSFDDMTAAYFIGSATVKKAMDMNGNQILV